MQRNFLTRRGEIDLILQRGSELLFVEVKGRTGEWEPAAWEESWRGKRRKLRATTRYFLAQRPEYFEMEEFSWEILFVSRGRVVGRYCD